MLLQFAVALCLLYVATGQHGSEPAVCCYRSAWLIACCMLLQVSMAHSLLYVATGHHGS